MKKVRLISILLSAIMVLYAFPLHGFAVTAAIEDNLVADEIIDELTQTESASEATDFSEEDAEPMILYEDETLRTDDTKHYRMTDGSFTAVKFDDVVHYEKDGEWEDIDNTLVLDPSSTTDNPVYRNFAGNVLFRFEGDPSDGKVSAEYDGYGISFELIDLPAPDVGLQPVPKPGDQVEVMSNGNEEAVESEIEIIIDKTPASEVEESVVAESEEPVEPGIEVSEPETELPVEETTGLDTEAVSEPETIEEEDSETLEPDEALDQESVGEDTTTEPDATDTETSTVVPETTLSVPKTTETKVIGETEGATAELDVEELETTELSESSISVNPDIDETLPILQERSFEIEIANPGKESAEIMTFAEATAESKVVTKQEEFTTFTLDQAFESVKSSSFINFTDPTDDFTISYNLSGNTLKENIIVNTKTDEYTYKFALNLVGLVPALMEDGSVSLNNTEGESIFTIPAPYMFDAENEYSSNVAYTLSGNATDGYVLTIIADPEWINAQDRTLPVVIDPALILSANGTDDPCMETRYFAANSTTDSGISSLVRIGRGSDNISYTGFFKVLDLPALPTNCLPVDARMYLFQYDYVGTLTSLLISATEASSVWYDTNGEILDYTYVTATDGENVTPVSWNITSAAKKWYDDQTTNTGIYLRPENPMGDAAYARADFYGYATHPELSNISQPKFIVQYRHAVGIENYYSYLTQEVGRAGTGYIRAYDTSLTFVKNDIVNNNTAKFFSLTHVYNSLNSELHFSNTTESSTPTYINTCSYNQMKVGRGWKLNVQQTIVAKNVYDIDGNILTYLVYNDADGTEHYFYDDPNDHVNNRYIDEDGLNLLIEASGNYHYLTNNKGDKLTFYHGYLYSIEDALGNEITVRYGNAIGSPHSAGGHPNNYHNRIISIDIMPSGETTPTVLAILTYNSGGLLSSITNKPTNLVTSFSYDSNGYLSNISHSDGSVMYYFYSAHNHLNCIFDGETNYGVEYTCNAKGEYIEILEFEGALDSSDYIIIESGATYTLHPKGNSITHIRYLGGDRQTETKDDIVTTYLFDVYGRTVNVYSANAEFDDSYAPFKVYGATISEYVPTTTTSFKTNNKVKYTASTGYSSLNYINNPGAEQTSLVWSKYTVSSGSIGITNEERHNGFNSFKIHSTSASAISTQQMYQLVTLEEDIYTLSAYIKATNLSTATNAGGVVLRIVNGNNVEVARSRVINTITNYNVESGWERLIAITPGDIPAGTYKVCISLIGASGTIYVDDIQLEANGGAGRVNLIDNGRAERDKGTQWTATPGSMFMFDTNSFSGDYSLATEPGINGSCQIENIVMTGAVENGETFVLSGWAKAYSVPIKDDDSVKFKLYAKLNYSDGTADFKDIQYNPDIRGEWQYGARTIVPNKDKTLVSITVVCYYAANNGKAYFDDISLTKEIVKSYKYDNNGNVISTNSGDSVHEDIYGYDAYTNLISTTFPGYGNYSYEYNEAHLMTNMSDGEAELLFGYDEAGNNTSVVVSPVVGSGKNMTVSSTYQNHSKLTSVTDLNGITKTFNYNSKNLLGSVVTPTSETETGAARNVTLFYKYFDNSERISMSYISGHIAISDNYTNGRISSIRRGGYYDETTQAQYYLINYDGFGNITEIYASSTEELTDSSKLLVSYTYESRNGLLKSIEFNNGDSISYTYTSLGNIKTITYNEVLTYTYNYNGDGLVSQIIEHDSGCNVFYQYDEIGRLIGYTKHMNNDLIEGQFVKYDTYGRICETITIDSDDVFTQTYTYNNDGTLSQSENNGSGTIQYDYDYLKRLGERSYNRVSGTSSNVLDTVFTYEDNLNNNNLTSQLVSEIEYRGASIISKYSYEYDNAGNIKHMFSEDGKDIYYFYDIQNQLIMENNESTGETYLYIYDTYGNIREKRTLYGNGYTTYSDALNCLATQIKSTRVYEYNDPEMLDALTCFNGAIIVYDSNNNPVEYVSADLTWDNGNQIVGVYNYDLDTETIYEYDSNGRRISKTVDGEEHIYNYDGSGNLISESWGAKKLNFFHDDQGIFGLKYINGTTEDYYYFLRSIQGDVLEILDEDMIPIARYNYDAWGRVVSVVAPNGSKINSYTHIANINPILYRGYYYDYESYFYYLNGRYYDPYTGRFIGANEGVINSNTTQFMNMFEYAGNNPVNITSDHSTFADNSDAITTQTANMPTLYQPKFSTIAMSNIYFDVPLYSQGGYSLCWAFCEQMLRDWMSNTCRTQEESTELAIQIAITYHNADGIGDKDKWNQGGIPPSRDLSRELSAKHITGYMDVYNMLLDNGGPLSASYYNGTGHSIIVTGADISNSTISVNNPWGCAGNQTYVDFMSGFYTPYGPWPDYPLRALYYIVKQ